MVTKEIVWLVVSLNFYPSASFGPYSDEASCRRELKNTFGFISEALKKYDNWLLKIDCIKE